MAEETGESKQQKTLTRGEFVKVGATVAAAGAVAAAARQRRSISEARLAAEQVEEHLVKTACALCPSGCGLEVRVVNGRAVKVEGNPLHPLNQGVCCLKGQTALEVLYSPERIQHPRIQTGARGSGDWKEISWEEALTYTAGKLADLRKAGLAHTLAFLHGQTRGEMRALVQRFMQAYGSPNVISQESLGEGAARLAMLLSQGVNGCPVYDFNNARYVIAFGGNLLEAGSGVIGALGATAFMRRGRPQRGKLVAVHPRLGLTGVKADEWVPIRPGTYGALALGMANVMINSQLVDADFVRDFTFGFEDFEDEKGQTHVGFKRLVLENYSLENVAAITGVPGETIARLAGEFATNLPALAVLPVETGSLTEGNSLYSALAVHALNALVGSLDAQGGVLVQRFPPLAAWPEFVADTAGQTGLAHERLDGAGTSEYPLATSIYQNVAGRILSGKPYPINALFLYQANPVYETPENGQFVQALMKVPFVVSFASTLDESAAHADMILPANTFLEDWGDDFLEGSGFAGVSLRQPVVEPVHDTRNPGDVLLQLAASLGAPMAQALPWKSYQELVRYRLSAIDMDWSKFEANGCWSEMVYFNAAPGSQAWSQVVGRDRLNAPQDGRFDLFSRELFALVGASGASQSPSLLSGQTESDLLCLPHFELPERLAEETLQAKTLAKEYPLLLVSQELITHSGVWQGIVPTLQECYGLQNHVLWNSWVEINPGLAASLGLKEGDLVWVESPDGRLQAQVRLYEGLWPNAVYLPPGQGHYSLLRWGRNSPKTGTVGCNPQQLTSFGSEPLSGQAITGPIRIRITKA